MDVYTIRSELGTVNGRTITLLGDLKNGRTVHSLVTLLSLYSVRLNFVSPPSLTMPASVVSAARKAGIPVYQCESLEEVLGETDWWRKACTSKREILSVSTTPIRSLRSSTSIQIPC